MHNHQQSKWGQPAIWSLLLLCVFLFPSCGDNNIEIHDEEEFRGFIQEEMDFQDIPAMSVLIFRGNEILYEQYQGQSNVQQNTSLTPDDLFLLASVSKVVTATALLQLFDDGEFELDDRINDYLPFEVSVPDQTTPITFRMLLTHTSGIADGPALDDQYYYGQDSPTALDYFLSNYLVPGGEFYDATDNFYDFEPGTQYEYSNEGSALIAVLVEAITNQDFVAYCHENIFTPLGMSRTFWRLEEAFQSDATIVQPYELDGRQLDPIEHYTFTDYPNGGLRSTGKDLFQFLSAFVQAGKTDGIQLLEASTVDAMLTPQIPNIDDEVGLHLFQLDASNNLWGHDGGEQGVATIMAFNPDTKVGAIILSNQGAADLEDILVEAYQLGLML